MIRRSTIIISFVIALTATACATPKEPPSSALRTITSTPHKSITVATVLTTTTISTTTVPPATTTIPAIDQIGMTEYAAWTKVAICEEGGWIGSSGPVYPNSLGINAQNWYAYGGGSDVSPAAQILVARRMVADLGISIPDQNGCAAW